MKVKDFKDFERFEETNSKYLLGYEKVDLNGLKILTVFINETMENLQINVFKDVGLNLNTRNLLTVTCNLLKIE